MELNGSEIAILGMACRFPGAATPEELWRNLIGGAESLTTLSDEQLRAAGVPAELIRDPAYVRRRPVLEGIDLFDAELFGYTPHEARLIDPQQRLFAECAWEALERGGYDPLRYPGSIGVFAGAKTNTYLFNIFTNREVFRTLDSFQLALGNDLASMTTRLSFKLDLRGPSYAVHTACSTSLVAVHLACQSLLLDECQMALAGGAAINVPQERGYRYQEGGILSPDGSCRTFDAGAAGSNFGNGVGAVLLKRLEDALADGDPIHAVIKGSATNNDGARKASYTAPGVEGQASVILEALAVSGVDADTLGYLEAHGTATELGDSIEMLALTEAFRASTEEEGFCAVGSVKTNLGHLETAAGIAGLIKTVLALERQRIPSSLHFQRPNPRLRFEGSPFYVAAEVMEWQRRGEAPRRAGVSSFGIGSTNAHVILEEAPPVPRGSDSRPWQLLLLSARTPAALEAQSVRLREHLDAPAEEWEPDPGWLADVAHTLQVGRREMVHRRAVVCRDTAGALAALAGEDPEHVFTHTRESFDRSLVFLFPGLGDHHLEMGLGLYQTEPVFRQELDRCAELLAPHLGQDLREVLFPEGPKAAPGQGERERGAGKVDLRRMLGRGGGEDEAARRRLDDTRLAQPAVFAVDYCLARLWVHWGLSPKVMAGYSLGEYVAATLAGVMELPDALRLVAERARRIASLPAGAMLAVPLPEEELQARLTECDLSLAAVNGPTLSVAAGPPEAVAELEGRLDAEGIVHRRLPTTHAFHSHMMEPLADELTELIRGFELKPPQIPYLSNLTGTRVSAGEATDPSYWARHMCRPVRFDAALAELLAEPAHVFLEVGPGQGLCSFVKQHPAATEEAGRFVLSSLPGAWGRQSEAEFLTTTLGKLWLAGVRPDWQAFYAGERRRRVTLPTYPFERQRHWIDGWLTEEDPRAAAGQETPAVRRVTLDKRPDPSQWFYRPGWRRADWDSATDLETGSPRAGGGWLVFDEGAGLGEEVAATLADLGQAVLRVLAGEGFAVLQDGTCTVAPGRREDYDALLTRAGEELGGVRRVLHLWSMTSGGEFELIQDRGFYSLLFLAQALGRRPGAAPVEIAVVTSSLARVGEGEELVPERAPVLGPVRVIPQEMPGFTCRAVDVVLGEEGLAAALVAEMGQGPEDVFVAWRAGERWVEDFVPEPLEPAPGAPSRLRPGGVYLISGGTGGLGLTVAEHLARTVAAKLVLTGRSRLPERERWDEELASRTGEDPLAVKLRALQRLEELGAEVLAVSADAADEAAMRDVVKQARQRFGGLDGVIHMAGVPGGGILQLKTREMAEAILAPKVQGARVLASLLSEDGGEPPDFLMLFSSIASVLGEFGQADYCGANAYLDALADQRQGTEGPRILTVDWDIWQRVGLAVHTEVPEHLKAWRQEMLEKALLPEEGVDAFDRILERGLPRIVVSTQDLPGRIELGRSLTAESFLRELGQQAAASIPSRRAPARRVLGTGFVAASGNLERRIAEIWSRVLGVAEVGVQDNFFDLGGNSLLGLQLVNEMSHELGIPIAPVALFEAPTVAALARQLQPAPAGAPGGAKERLAERRRRLRQEGWSRDIAVIATAGRFPGAASVEELWKNLTAGRESITFFTDQELLAAGVDPQVMADPRYVRAGAILEDVDHFDAGLFGYSPREAEVMDPQHRVFLECAWEALERAGYDPKSYPGSVGVFAGSNLSTYLLRLHGDPRVRGSVNMLQAILGNDKDSLTTTVSYKLDLKGPSVAVQTFCSTSLVAVHMAMQSLRSGECDMALAGGIRIVVPVRQGYLWERGGIAPSDGHSRSFDARADGSVLGNGVGIVVLKRLEDALEDGDPVLAVLKGSAINNDGSLKAGYTAPSVAGQAEAVAAAYEDAGLDPGTVSYLEAHGSATELGDPIEVTALTQAFRRWTRETGYCPIGSVKSNFGHLDRAAGVTGLIKTVLALQHRQIPPSLHFEEPNPKIDFAGSPFYVQTELTGWPANGTPRRAGVNSLGMGGTNVHVVVEEAPERPVSSPSRPWQLLVLSAASEGALESITAKLAKHFEEGIGEDLADAAYTLKVGRRALAHRRIAVCRDASDAVRALGGEDPRRRLSSYCEEGERKVVLLLPGLGSQYVGMGRDLYETEETFRREVDRCAELLHPLLDADIREAIYPPTEGGRDEATENLTGGGRPALDLKKMLGRGGEAGDGEAARRLAETRLTQPALFVVEWALAQLWREWGLAPAAMIGYSLGEYVAAALSGVLSLEDALTLVAKRADLIQGLEPGAMLAVGLDEGSLAPWLGQELSLMAVNGPEQSVASGPVAAIEALEEALTAEGVACRRLQTSHAFHSSMMEPLFDEVVELARQVELREPEIPYLSNVSGTWITAEEATDPTYWARHMCSPVRFSEGISELLTEPARLYLEVGPGQTLASLLLQHPEGSGQAPPAVVATLRHSYETRSDAAFALEALGKAWLLGAAVDWEGFYTRERRHRVLLPTYPFERRRYWIETVDAAAGEALPAADGVARFYAPSWRRGAPPVSAASPRSRWLVLGDGALAEGLASRLADTGGEVVRARAGQELRRLDDVTWELPSGDAEAHRRLLEELAAAARVPEGVVDLRGLASGTDGAGESELLDCQEPEGFGGLQALGWALGELPQQGGSAELALWVVTSGVVEVSGEEPLEPAQAILLGALQMLRREVNGLACGGLDLVPPAAQSSPPERLLDQLQAELSAASPEPIVALRGAHRWVPGVEPLAAGAEASGPAAEGGLYLVTHGLGELGFPFACHLASVPGARLLLVEPPGFPAREEWDDWLADEAGMGMIRRRIRNALALGELGAQVFVTGADVTDGEAVATLLERAEECHGRLRGVVHVVEPEVTAAAREAAGGNGHLHLEDLRAPWVLDRLLCGRELGFRLLVAPSAAPNGPHATAAAAASLYLDAFAGARARAAGRWTSVAWDLPATATGGESQVLGRLFALAASPLAQVVVSPRPLTGSWHKVVATPLEPEVSAGPAVGFYPRPNLRVEYVAPRTELETTVAEIWRDLLGVEQVGLHDNFLDLGGDSLLATRLVSRMRDALGLDLPVRLFFERSTVGELAEAVEELRHEEARQETEELLSRIQELSEEELEQEISRMEQLMSREGVADG